MVQGARDLWVNGGRTLQRNVCVNLQEPNAQVHIDTTDVARDFFDRGSSSSAAPPKIQIRKNHLAKK